MRARGGGGQGVNGSPRPPIVIPLSQYRLLVCKERKKEMFYLTTDATHFIYGYMVSDIW